VGGAAVAIWLLYTRASSVRRPERWERADGMSRKLTRHRAGTTIPETIIMYHTTRFHDTACRQADTLFATVVAYVEEHREALQHAAELLAGRRGAALAARIAEDLSDAPSLSRRCRRDLEDLLDILALENVDDPESEEAARFAALDPASSVVEEICLLTEGLRDILEQAGTDQSPASRASIAA
jgi:hypothetical protein